MRSSLPTVFLDAPSNGVGKADRVNIDLPAVDEDVPVSLILELVVYPSGYNANQYITGIVLYDIDGELDKFHIEGLEDERSTLAEYYAVVDLNTFVAFTG